MSIISHYVHLLYKCCDFKSVNNQTPTYVKELLTFSNNSFYNLRSTVKKSNVKDKPNSKVQKYYI